MAYVLHYHTQTEDMACLLLEPISKGKEALRFIIIKQGVIKKKTFKKHSRTSYLVIRIK